MSVGPPLAQSGCGVAGSAMGAGHSRGRNSRGPGRLARRSGRGWRSGRCGRGRAGRPCCSRSARTGGSGRRRAGRPRPGAGCRARRRRGRAGRGAGSSLMCQTMAAGVPPQAGRSPVLRMALRTSPNASCIRTSCGRASRLPGTSAARRPSHSDSSLVWSGCSAHPRSAASGVAGTAGAGLDQASSTTRAASPVSWFRSACRVYPACPRFFHSRSPRCLSAWATSRRVPSGSARTITSRASTSRSAGVTLAAAVDHLGLHHRAVSPPGPGRGAWPGSRCTVRACSAGDHTRAVTAAARRGQRRRQDFPGERHRRGDRVGQVDPPLGLATGSAAAARAGRPPWRVGRSGPARRRPRPRPRSGSRRPPAAGAAAPGSGPPRAARSRASPAGPGRSGRGR